MGGVVIKIRRTRSDRNAAEFYGYPYFTFHLEEIFCAHIIILTAQDSITD